MSKEVKEIKSIKLSDPIIDAEFKRLALLYRDTLKISDATDKDAILSIYRQEMQTLQLVEQYL